MKKLFITILLLAFVSPAYADEPHAGAGGVAHADHGGGGGHADHGGGGGHGWGGGGHGWGGGRGYGGYGYGGYGWGGDWIWPALIGGAIGYDMAYPYRYSYPYAPYPYPVYDQPPVYVQPAPTYVQPAPAYVAPPPPQSVPMWYYCESAKGYYPYVPSCAEGWKPVPSVPPQGSAPR